MYKNVLVAVELGAETPRQVLEAARNLVGPDAERRVLFVVDSRYLYYYLNTLYDSDFLESAEASISKQAKGELAELCQPFRIGVEHQLVRVGHPAAESCTGGLFAAHATDIPGSSNWFYGSFVTYTLAAKRRLLGVDSETLEHWGAVSEPCAREMAAGALKKTAADICVVITGLAGPDGGDFVTPKGTVWFAWARRGESLVHTAQHCFEGDRREIREAAAQRAAIGLLWMLE